jgi:alkanesulfonate monooxygenase SsuD/methylene tetrahydromethanopterin reductase-like flavin-dependent oxidoreductase (luciferase family)
MKILPAVSLFVGKTKEEAQGKFKYMQELVHPQAGLSTLYARFGDLSDYPLDGPVPEPTETQSAAKRIYEIAKRNNFTIRQLGSFLGAGTSGRMPVIGTPKDIADFLEEWFTTGAADGFNVTPGYLPHQMQDFADLVVPELQRRGLFRKEYAGPTFRDQLGLPKHMPKRG